MTLLLPCVCSSLPSVCSTSKCMWLGQKRVTQGDSRVCHWCSFHMCSCSGKKAKGSVNRGEGCSTQHPLSLYWPRSVPSRPFELGPDPFRPFHFPPTRSFLHLANAISEKAPPGDSRFFFDNYFFVFSIWIKLSPLWLSRVPLCEPEIHSQVPLAWNARHFPTILFSVHYCAIYTPTQNAVSESINRLLYLIIWYYLICCIIIHLTLFHLGTTWVQEIVWQIFHEGRVESTSFDERVPFLEWVGNPNTPDINTLPSPRILKTHLSYNIIPKRANEDSKCKYIYVARNPKDVAVSFFKFLTNSEGFKGPWEFFVKLFLQGNGKFIKTLEKELISKLSLQTFIHCLLW